MTTGKIGLIDDWFNKPIPETLWHYTSLQGFLGIVKSKGIFATDVRYLNDREEFIHTQSFIDEAICQLDEVDENGWTKRKQVKEVLDMMYAGGVLSPKYWQVFVASFSTAEDQLGQWRGYSRRSTGVSLGFDLTDIRRGPTPTVAPTGVSLGFDLTDIRPDPALNSLAVFSECIYDDDNKREFVFFAIDCFAQNVSAIFKQISDADAIKGLLQKLKEKNPTWTDDQAKEELKKTKQEWMEKELRQNAALLARDLLRLGALQKHASFREEKEWRLVLPMKTDTIPTVHPRQFRAGETTLIPFVEFDLAHGGKPFPLTHVILGPGSETNGAIEATQSFLVSEKLSITPKLSKAPFRPW